MTYNIDHYKMNISIHNDSSTKQYWRKRDIITRMKTLNIYHNDAINLILNDLINNTVMQVLELRNIHDFVPINKSIQTLCVKSHSFFGHKSWHLLSNITTLHLIVERLVDYDPFTNKLNRLSNLRHLSLNVSNVESKALNLPNLINLTFVGVNIDYETFIKFAKHNCKTLIISIDLFDFPDKINKINGINGHMMYERNKPLKCLKLIDNRHHSFDMECCQIWQILDTYKNIVDFEIESATKLRNYERLFDYVNINRSNSKEYVHKEIIEIYITLVRYLPPYVMLWIMDWIPLFDLFSRSYKIRLLESIYHNFLKKIGEFPDTEEAIVLEQEHNLSDYNS